MRTVLGTVAMIVVVAFGLLALGPQALGGPVVAVSTFGDSMLPTHDAHDLVIVRRAASYAVGDVIAFRSETLGAVVLHRIVGAEGSGYLTQGDNNDWLDPDRPTAGDVIGRAWLSVPQLGRLLELPAPVRMLLPFALGGLVVALTRRRRQSAPKRARRRRPAPTPASATRPAAVWNGAPARMLITGLLAVTAGGLLAVIAWTQPSTGPAVVEYEHTGTFGYGTSVPVSAVYPDGTIDPGEPVFLRITDRVDVTFDWRLQSPSAATVEGSGQLVAIVADGSGWTGRVPLGPVLEWTGPEATLTGLLDLRSIRRLGEEVTARTGLGGSSRTVALTAELTVQGRMAGQAFTSQIAPSMDLQVDELRAGPAVSADASDPLEMAEAGTLTVPASQVAEVTIGPVVLPVPVARAASLAVLVIGALLAAGATAVARRTRSWDEARRISAGFGDDLVDALGISASSGTTLVSLGGIEELVAVARHRGLPVLRVPLKAGGDGYFVDDGGTRYRYDVRPPAEPRVPSPVLDEGRLAGADEQLEPLTVLSRPPRSVVHGGLDDPARALRNNGRGIDMQRSSETTKVR